MLLVEEILQGMTPGELEQLASKLGVNCFGTKRPGQVLQSIQSAALEEGEV